MSLNVLVVDRSPPIGLTQGNALIGQHIFPRLASRGHRLTLVSPSAPERLETALPELRGTFVDAHLLPRSSQIDAVTGFFGARTGIDHGLAGIGHAVSELTSINRFDVVHVRQLPMAPSARGAGPVGRLLELVDSETLGTRRSIAGSRWHSLRRLARGAAAALAERSAMQEYDIVTTVAEPDAAVLRELAPEARIEIIPNGVDTDFFTPAAPSRDGSADLVFVGAMSYPPNIAAIRHFIQGAWQVVRASRPDARLHIVGRDPTTEVREFALLPGIEVTGKVDDVRPFLWKSSVFVCPMISGSGVKNKLLEAMATGCAVVATRLSVEGLDVADQQELLIADSDEDLAKAVLRLLSDARLRVALAHRARLRMEASHSWERCVDRYEGVYAELAALTEHRRAGTR